jgi:hypothetical protein
MLFVIKSNLELPQRTSWVPTHRYPPQFYCSIIKSEIILELRSASVSSLTYCYIYIKNQEVKRRN